MKKAIAKFVPKRTIEANNSAYEEGLKIEWKTKEDSIGWWYRESGKKISAYRFIYALPFYKYK